MLRIGVIGKREKISAFAAVGFDVFPAENADHAWEVLEDMVAKDYGVIFVTDDHYTKFGSDISLLKCDEMPTPAIVPIPAGQGESIGMAQLTRYIERAVGSDVEFGE